MAIIHDTTMNPEKLDLLATWMPAQSWFPGGGRAPALAKAGGILATAEHVPGPRPGDH
jgi:hypothetical protein